MNIIADIIKYREAICPGMRLVIDTRSGLAGDIMCAGLIGLGADPDSVCGAMEAAGRTLGPTAVSHACSDGIHRMRIGFEGPGHLHADMAAECLGQAIESCGIAPPWSMTAEQILQAMAVAEGAVHSEHPMLKHRHHGAEAVLHEASDILIDIAGAAAGMESLGITEVSYIGFVGVGSGTVTFSHGILDVPTPATKYILEKHGIPWAKTDTGMEAATPTGAAMLAGCKAASVAEPPEGCRNALAGGTRPLPPVAFYLAE